MIRIHLPFVLLIALLAGCADSSSTQSALDKDAVALCRAYDEDNWKNIDGLTSIDEFQAIVDQRVKAGLQTEAVRAVVDGISDIEFYREVYPFAKSEMEELTNSEWNCPALEAFYSIEVTKNQSGENVQSKQTTITASGDHLFGQKKIALGSESADDVKSELMLGDQIASKVVVIMEAGANDQHLDVLFGVLAGLGVENISVHSDE